MVRLSKQQRKRQMSPRKPKHLVRDAKKNSIQQFAKIHKNAIEGVLQDRIFIPEVKGRESRHV